MKPSYNDLFLEILSILNYEDKENFVKRFEQMNHLEAVTNCIEKLPESIKAEILARPEDPQTLMKYLSKDEYIQEVTTVSTKALGDFLQHVTPALTEEQKEKISAAFLN
ncbi:MAG TPA: hypothetical protein VLF93_00790 [Candidatus Saccharimonadales bacterium]|nr:hypothetical protein [Candidatus Saccharimonadales bacterium]